MVVVARIRVQLEGLGKTRDQKAKGKEGRESGAIKRRRLSLESKKEAKKDRRKAQKQKRTLGARISRRAGQATSLAGRAAAPGAVTGAVGGLGGGLIGAVARRAPIVIGVVAAAQALDKFGPLIEQAVTAAVGKELGSVFGGPLQEIGVFIRRVKRFFDGLTGGISEQQSLVTDLRNAGVDPDNPALRAALDPAFVRGSAINKADADIESAFESEASIRNILNNVEFVKLIVKKVGEHLLSDAGFLGNITAYFRKVFKL